MNKKTREQLKIWKDNLKAMSKEELLAKIKDIDAKDPTNPSVYAQAEKQIADDTYWVEIKEKVIDGQRYFLLPPEAFNALQERQLMDAEAINALQSMCSRLEAELQNIRSKQSKEKK